MPITPSFSVSQQVGLPDTLTLTDTSTGSDASIVARVVILEIWDGTFLPPDNAAATEVVAQEVKAISYIGGVTLQNTGDPFEIYVNDPVLGVIKVGQYDQVSGDTLATLITGIIAAIGSGYSAENYTSTTLNVIAKAGLGATINGNNATVSWPFGSSTNDFQDGVTQKSISVTASQIYWPYADATISLDVLDKDYAINITVLWLDEDGVTVESVSNPFGLTSYNEDFDFGLTSVLASNPLLINDNSFRVNKSNVRLFIDSGDQAVTRSSDITSAQICYDEATKIRLKSVYYFNESSS